MNHIISIFCLLVFSSTAFAQSKVVKEWKEQDKIETGYYMYPSTLRMINLERDPSFDKLVKPIRKMSFMNLRQDSMSRTILRKSAQRIIAEENYDTYAEMEGPSNSLFVLGRESKGYTCVLAYNEEEYYVAEIEGMIDFLQLTKLYEKISSADSTSEMGILNVLDLMGGDRNRIRSDQERRRKWKEEKAEKKRIEQMKQDSINALEPKSQEVIQE